MQAGTGICFGAAGVSAAAASSSLPRPSGYQPRWGRPSVLQQVLREQLQRFVDEAQQADRVVPDFVLRELKDIAWCGDPDRGLTRWRCPHCAWERVLVFRCKSSLCPTCAGRRMAEKTSLLLDVLPSVSVRHWTTTFPFSLRYLLAYDAELTGQLASIVVSSPVLLAEAPGQEAPRPCPACDRHTAQP